MRDALHCVYWELDSAALADRTYDAIQRLQTRDWILTEGAQQKPRLSGYFATEKDARLHAKRLRSELPWLDSEPSLERIETSSWALSYREHFHPFRVGRFTVHPSWEELPHPSPEVMLVLDPMLAFGTDHPTTRLCLLGLERFATGRDVSRYTFIDAGSGSGILSIAALKLGFRSGVAFDLDSKAVTATRDNARRNGVTSRLLVRRLALGSRAPSPPVNLVFANIHKNLLLEHARLLLSWLKPEARLLLSGLLTEDLPGVRAHYRSVARELGMSPLRTTGRTLDGWATLCIDCQRSQK